MDKYKLLGVAGEGQYGTVYRAQLKGSKQLVAIKKFKGREDDATHREIDLLRELKHPNIVSLRETFRVQGKLHIVFEYVPQDMLAVLGSFPSGIPQDTVKSYIRQLCRALVVCHAKNICHRDVKPENLLVSGKPGAFDPDERNLKLCDFGVARHIYPGDGQLTGYVSTRWYRAPELLTSSTLQSSRRSRGLIRRRVHAKYRDYTHSVDVWAVGCVMAELLTSRPLFPGSSAADQLDLIRKYGGIGVGANPNGRSILRERLKGKICAAGFDFICRVLNMTPSQRLTAKEALEHEYLRTIEKKVTSSNDSGKSTSPTRGYDDEDVVEDLVDGDVEDAVQDVVDKDKEVNSGPIEASASNADKIDDYVDEDEDAAYHDDDFENDASDVDDKVVESSSSTHAKEHRIKKAASPPRVEKVTTTVVTSNTKKHLRKERKDRRKEREDDTRTHHAAKVSIDPRKPEGSQNARVRKTSPTSSLLSSARGPASNEDREMTTLSEMKRSLKLKKERVSHEAEINSVSIAKKHRRQKRRGRYERAKQRMRQEKERRANEKAKRVAQRQKMQSLYDYNGRRILTKEEKEAREKRRARRFLDINRGSREYNRQMRLRRTAAKERKMKREQKAREAKRERKRREQQRGGNRARPWRLRNSKMSKSKQSYGDNAGSLPSIHGSSSSFRRSEHEYNVKKKTRDNKQIGRKDKASYYGSARVNAQREAERRILRKKREGLW